MLVEIDFHLLLSASVLANVPVFTNYSAHSSRHHLLPHLAPARYHSCHHGAGVEGHPKPSLGSRYRPPPYSEVVFRQVRCRARPRAQRPKLFRKRENGRGAGRLNHAAGRNRLWGARFRNLTQSRARRPIICPKAATSSSPKPSTCCTGAWAQLAAARCHPSCRPEPNSDK